MLTRSAIRLIGLALGLFLSLPENTHAESAHDRVALMLSGPDCPAVQHTLTAALQQHPGVLHVDTELMPDHVLVDIVRQGLTGETLAEAANATIGRSQCRAEIMKSCITAEPSGHHADSSQAAEGLAQSH